MKIDIFTIKPRIHMYFVPSKGLFLCTVLVAVCALLIRLVPLTSGSGMYEIALGAIASGIVSFIVELGNNRKLNQQRVQKLWNEFNLFASYGYGVDTVKDNLNGRTKMWPDWMLEEKDVPESLGVDLYAIWIVLKSEVGDIRIALDNAELLRKNEFRVLSYCYYNINQILEDKWQKLSDSKSNIEAMDLAMRDLQKSLRADSYLWWSENYYKQWNRSQDVKIRKKIEDYEREFELKRKLL